MQIPSEILPREQGHRVFGVARSRRLPESRLSETLTESLRLTSVDSSLLKTPKIERKKKHPLTLWRRSSYCNAPPRERERQKIASQEDLLAFSLVKNKSPINDLSRLVKILSRLLTQEAFGNMKRHLLACSSWFFSNIRKTIIKEI